MSHHTNIRAANRYTRYASALLCFAQKQPTFLSIIAAHIKSIETPTSLEDVTTYPVSSYAVPDTLEQATTRLAWLVGQLAQKPKYETKEAIALLHAATRDVELPKNLVIGIIGFAVTFIDLGIVKKKKKKLAMRIIAKDTLRTAPVAEHIQYTHEVTGALLATELRSVFGNAQELDPDLAEWLFSDRATRLYYASHSELTELATLLKNEHLAHSVRTDDTGSITHIALSPSVSETLSVGEEATS